MLNKSVCALILGGNLNGYSIIKELYENKIENIVLFNDRKNIASASNKINFFKKVLKTTSSLKKALDELHESYTYIVIFPTTDSYLELLNDIYDEISEYCFAPINPKNLSQSIDKYIQYKYCEKLDIPYPKTQRLESFLDSPNNITLNFPIIIKPIKHVKSEAFRTLYFSTKIEFDKKESYLKKLVGKGNKFIVSEFIPGDDTNLYSYIAYRSRSGKILNEWSCKKLTQVHGPFGVFSSISNECPEIIAEYGRKLFEEMNLMGICDAEFKYDHIEESYKLVEINLRPPMNHRIGNKSGVHLLYTQFLDAIGSSVPKQVQDKSKIIHLVYMHHEIVNLVRRKNYWKHFKHNVFGGDERHFAVFDATDLRPILHELIFIGKKLVNILV
ncbi:MAG: hypothetical protein ACQ9MH_10045 [Nitrospinales bacterium]